MPKTQKSTRPATAGAAQALAETLLEAGKPRKSAAGRPARKAAVPPAATAYPPEVAGILKKYRLADANGQLRQTQSGEAKVFGPVLSPQVIDKFLALDGTQNKRIFDWMLHAAGGGSAAQKESALVLELAHAWVLKRRVAGEDEEGRKIAPLSKEEAEVYWKTECEDSIRQDCFCADEDTAIQSQYQVFCYYRNWPGRDNIYADVVAATEQFLAIQGDKGKQSEYNRLNPKTPIPTSLWLEDGSPRYESAQALAQACRAFRASFARRRAEKNVTYIGAADPVTGEHARGSDVTFYSDANVTVKIPATAMASRQSGHPDWCVANKSRWLSYFDSQDKGAFSWGGYSTRGPLVYWQVHGTLNDAYLAQVAGHMVGAAGRVPEGIEFWDKENTHLYSWPELRARLAAQPITGLVNSFEASFERLKAWLANFKKADIENFPALESCARQLVAGLLD